MSQVITKEHTIIEEVKNLTTEQQNKVLEFIKFLQYQESNKQKEQKWLNLAEENSNKKQISFAEDAKEFIGCVDGGNGNLALLKHKLKRINLSEVFKDLV